MFPTTTTVVSKGSSRHLLEVDEPSTDASPEGHALTSHNALAFGVALVGFVAVAAIGFFALATRQNVSVCAFHASSSLFAYLSSVYVSVYMGAHTVCNC